MRIDGRQVRPLPIDRRGTETAIAKLSEPTTVVQSRARWQPFATPSLPSGYTCAFHLCSWRAKVVMDCSDIVERAIRTITEIVIG
jgi:hypothetical protein